MGETRVLEPKYRTVMIIQNELGVGETGLDPVTPDDTKWWDLIAVACPEPGIFLYYWKKDASTLRQLKELISEIIAVLSRSIAG